MPCEHSLLSRRALWSPSKHPASLLAAGVVVIGVEPPGVILGAARPVMEPRGSLGDEPQHTCAEVIHILISEIFAVAMLTAASDAIKKSPHRCLSLNYTSMHHCHVHHVRSNT